MILFITFLASISIGLFIFLSMHEKPYDFGIFAPILIILFSIYYLLFFYGLYKFDSFKDHLNVVLDAFEEECGCKI